LRIVAKDLGCELIPVHSYWAGYLAEHNVYNKDLVLSDCRYPNESGHQVMAEAIMKHENPLTFDANMAYSDLITRLK